MAPTARGSIAAYRRSHDEMSPILAGFGEEELLAQSGAAEWSVAQVLGHLGGASEIALATLRSGAADPAGHQEVWDRWNALPPAERAAGYVDGERRLVEALEALSDADIEGRRLDLGFMPQPVDVRMFTEMRLSEVAHHRWDVDVAFDKAAGLAPYLVEHVLSLVPMFAGFLSRPIGQTGTVAIHTTGPVRSYLLELTDDGCSASGAAEAGEPAAGAGTTVRMPAEAFARLTAGRLAPAHTPDGVSVSGALTLDDLRRLFPGF